MNAILRHWQFIAALMAVAAVSGAQQVEIENLKDEVEQVDTMQQQAARVDERTEQMQTEQREQRALLLDILREMRGR